MQADASCKTTSVFATSLTCWRVGNAADRGNEVKGTVWFRHASKPLPGVAVALQSEQAVAAAAKENSKESDGAATEDEFFFGARKRAMADFLLGLAPESHKHD